MIGGTPSRVQITQLEQAATFTCEDLDMRSGPLTLAPTLSKTGRFMMIRYFFDIRNDQELYPDEDGIEFSTQREAEIEAAHTLAGLHAIWRVRKTARTLQSRSEQRRAAYFRRH